MRKIFYLLHFFTFTLYGEISFLYVPIECSFSTNYIDDLDQYNYSSKTMRQEYYYENRVKIVESNGEYFSINKEGKARALIPVLETNELIQFVETDKENYSLYTLYKSPLELVIQTSYKKGLYDSFGRYSLSPQRGIVTFYYSHCTRM